MKNLFLGCVAIMVLAFSGCSPATRYFNPNVTNKQRDADYRYCTERVPLGIEAASKVNRIPDLNNDEFNLIVARCMKSRGYSTEYQGEMIFDR
jgi:hypothetical protein